MPIKLKLDTVQKLLVAHTAGQVTADDIIAATEDEIVRTNGVSLHSDCIILLDRTTDYHRLDFDAMMRLKDKMEYWVKRYPGRNVRVAFVVPHGRHLAVPTLWQAIGEMFPRVGERTKIFASDCDALGWLRPGDEVRH